MNVKVLLNQQEDEEGRIAIFTRPFSGAYQLGDKLEYVYEYEDNNVDGDARVLERAFAKFNRGTGTFVGNEEYPHRSLSIGDVVEIDGRRYACEPSGWKDIDTPLAQRLAEAWTTQDDFEVPMAESAVLERLDVSLDETEQGLTRHAVEQLEDFVQKHVPHAAVRP